LARSTSLRTTFERLTEFFLRAWDFRAKNVRQGAKADHFPAFVDVGWVHAESLASAKAAQGSGPPRQAVE
jgi:hypothetical protein